jgi:hypothetical protein
VIFSASTNEFLQLLFNQCRGYDVVEKGPAVRVNNKSDIFALEITRLSFDPNVARIGGKTGNLQYDDTFIPFHAADIERQPSNWV